MAMHERRSMGRDLDLEDAYILVVDDKVVRGFSGDLDLGRGLGEQQWNQQERNSARFMAGIVAPEEWS
jgi:hypothetical protein